MADGSQFIRPVGHRALPVTIRGVSYRSQTEAAEALGVSISAVRRGRIFGYLDNVGLPLMPVTIAGVTYASVRTAHEATGHSITAIYAAVERGDTGALGRRRPGAVHRRKPVRIGPLSWPSRKAAMRALKVGWRMLDAAVTDPASPAGHRCLGRAMALCAKERTS